MIKNSFVIIFCILISCADSADKTPHVEIRTRYGNIEVELYPDKAPQSVTAFLKYVDSGMYKKAAFYRVLTLSNQPSDYHKAELIQGGIWRRNRTRAEALAGIPHETTQQTGILHKDGVISFARLAPGTAKTEFFICMGDQPGFDYEGENNPDKQGYAAFGRVVKGMDIARRIYRAPEEDQSFDPPVDIYNIVRRN